MASNKILIAIAVVLIAALLAITLYVPEATGQGPWTWIGGGWGTTPTPAPSWNPWTTNPTVSPTNQPTPPPFSSTPTPDVQPVASGHLWQTLYVTEDSGRQYWYNAPQPFIMQSIYGKENQATEFQKISKISNDIWMKLNTNLPVDHYVFRCDETIYVIRGTQYYILVNQQPVIETRYNFENNQNVKITGAEIDAASLQALMNNAGVPNNIPGVGVTVPATFNIALNHIEIDIHYTNGQVLTVSPQSNTESNVLTWQIILVQ